MNSLHDILHELNDNLIDIRSVIKASDELTTELFKKHLYLLRNTSIKVNLIEERIDQMFNDKVNVHKTDTGAFM